jgi:hypothetical protein
MLKSLGLIAARRSGLTRKAVALCTVIPLLSFVPANENAFVVVLFFIFNKIKNKVGERDYFKSWAKTTRAFIVSLFSFNK